MTGFATHLATAPPSLWALDGDLPADALAATCRSVGFDVRTVDLAGVKDKAGLLDAFATALAFPEWAGRNWDALADALGDLSWLPAGGRVVLVRGTAALVRTAPGDWRTALEIMEEAAEASGDTGWAPPGGPIRRGLTAGGGRSPVHFVTLP